MPKTDDGGAAFPTPGVYVDENISPREMEEFEAGMTLRDWFAGRAMATLLTAPAIAGAGIVADATDQLRADVIARTAYAQADAMIRARKG